MTESRSTQPQPLRIAIRPSRRTLFARFAALAWPPSLASSALLAERADAAEGSDASARS